MTEKIEIRYSKIKLGALALMCLVFCTMGAFVIVTGGSLILGIFIISVCVVAGIMALKQLLNSRPVIVVDAEGIHDRTTASYGLIRWDNITGIDKVVRRGKYGTKSYSGIVILVKDKSETVQNPNAIEEMLMSGSRRLDYHINTQLLAVSSDELLNILRNTHQKYLNM